VAKGAKGTKRGQSSLMQIGTKLKIAWSIRKDMGTLTAIEVDNPLIGLSQQWLLAAFYLNELLIKLLHQHESHPKLFNAYDSAIGQLSKQEDEQSTLRVFEKYLLESLGYGLILDHDVITGEVIKPNKQYYYRLNIGPTTQSDSSGEQVTIDGRTIVELNENRLSNATVQKQAKRLMRFVLNELLGDQPLSSRELYRAYISN